MYGKPGGPLSEAAATAGPRAARLMLSQQRLFTGAMRAIHRAETAAENQALNRVPEAAREMSTAGKYFCG
jgi:phosphoenolpyruvate-protein kinase (PTS system EI component)